MTKADLVEEVVRPAKEPTDAARTLPDVIVHWKPALHEESITTRPLGIEIGHVAVHRTGQHTGNAFCVASGPAAEAMQQEIATEDLHRVIVSGLR